MRLPLHNGTAGAATARRWRPRRKRPRRRRPRRPRAASCCPHSWQTGVRISVSLGCGEFWTYHGRCQSNWQNTKAKHQGNKEKKIFETVSSVAPLPESLKKHQKFAVKSMSSQLFQLRSTPFNLDKPIHIPIQLMRPFCFHSVSSTFYIFPPSGRCTQHPPRMQNCCDPLTP